MASTSLIFECPDCNHPHMKKNLNIKIIIQFARVFSFYPFIPHFFNYVNFSRFCFHNLSWHRNTNRLHFTCLYKTIIVTCSHCKVEPPDISLATAIVIELLSLIDSSIILRLELNSFSCSSVPESRAMIISSKIICWRQTPYYKFLH